LVFFSNELAFLREAWPNVSIQLIDAVKHGYRPIIPEDAPQLLVPLIMSCWQESASLRPCAERVLQLLEETMNNVVLTPVLPESSTSSVDNSDTFLPLDMTESPTLVSTDEANCQEMAVNAQLQSAQLQEMDGGNVIESVPCSSDNGDVTNETLDLTEVKSILNVSEFKPFQVDCVTTVNQGKGVIVAQPTGSGKSMCFVIPALLMKQKVSLVIEPVLAVIFNQIEGLKHKGINAVALGNPAG